MTKPTTPTRQCAWHHKDGSPCTAQTILAIEDFGNIPACRSHLKEAFTTIYDQATMFADDMVARIEEDAIRAHREEQGCEVLAYLAAQPRTYVYYMRAGEYVKIGRSRNPVARAAQLRYGSAQGPDDLDRSSITLERVEEGGAEDEALRHAQFAHLRVAGEWFASSPELEGLMSTLDRMGEALEREAGGGVAADV